jgi:FHS family L-fucose permease-like MFS transporter
VLLTGGVFAAGAVVTAATRTQSLRSIDMAFLGMGAFFAVVAFFIFTARKKINVAAPAATEAVSPLKALSSPWAIFGALAIFLYVGSEVAIGGMLTNFLESPDILNAPIETAGKMVALYWGGAMVGRFIGSWVLSRVSPGVVLACCTVAAAALCLLVSQIGGPTAAYAVLSIGLFNSIMFPTIFTLTLERSTAPTSATSGLLIFGIIGGALLPQVAARIADAAGALQPAFLVPMAGYVGLTVFAIACARTKAKAEVTTVASH